MEIRNVPFSASFVKDGKSQRNFLGHQKYDEMKLSMNTFKRKYIKAHMSEMKKIQENKGVTHCAEKSGYQ